MLKKFATYAFSILALTSLTIFPVNSQDVNTNTGSPVDKTNDGNTHTNANQTTNTNNNDDAANSNNPSKASVDQDAGANDKNAINRARIHCKIGVLNCKAAKLPGEPPGVQ
jgi:hypothetical protein